MKEMDTVILTADLPDAELQAGDVGVVVLVHDGGAAFEVEFLCLGGETLAVKTLTASQVRPAASREIAHARRIAG